MRKLELPVLGRHSPRLTRLRRIVRRQEGDLTVAEGVKLVRDLAAAGVEMLELYATPERARNLPSLPSIEAAVAAGRAYLVDAATFDRLAPTQHSQGLIAIVTAPAHALQGEGVVLFLDRIQDPGNLGALIRCAAAFGASGVACSAGCADPFSPRAVRSSAGHALLLPVQTEVAFEALVPQFKAAGGSVVATTGRGGVPLHLWLPKSPLLLAVGNEGVGLSQAILDACDERVTVPLSGGVESLNVTVAAGVVLAALAGVAGPPILEPHRSQRRSA
jgi:RNA methyltransferase, TrmH family